ncbi:hypothetical protein POL68_04060 [Stigmatella sp. ncwal1]|uniref:Lipoprotein n=1 Tax=Stigmatella ashevillensis TaxID=2995309 RepID=A0ABT5D1V7_9BACT|nr:hypothetical protein [Stigmatella ashevillena]MDC0707635.1 hypothetical protein [Stigmatella ashevillena]
MRSSFRPLLLLALASTGCATSSRGPVPTAEAYARALEENRLPQAYALTTGLPEGEPAFRTRYADPAARRERAAAVRAGLPLLEGHAPALTMELRESSWRVVETLPTDEVKATLARFLNAAETTDWEKAWSLLSAPLRARYTPDRLREDFQREPLARERLRRARLALKGDVKVSGNEATFPLGAERAVRLVLEAGEYRVAAIE